MNKIQKKLMMLLVALVATTAFAACSSSSGDDDGVTVSGMKLLQTALTFTNAGGTQTVSVQAAEQARATSSADWCTVSAGAMSPALKVTPVTVTVAANTTTAERTAVITITAGSETQTVSVSQEKGEEPVVEPEPKPAPTGPVKADASQIARQMYPGWNLGNTLEATGSGLGAETSWQPTKTTQAVIDAVQTAGFKGVRLPCSWDIHSDASGKIDAAWMARVKEVVNYCIADGLYVVLNDHWDNGWIEVLGFSKSSSTYQAVDDAYVEAKIARLKNLWTQIATEFIDYDEHLLFAGLNEPFQEYGLFNGRHQQLSPILIRYNKAFVEAVRATGGNNALRTLVVQGPSTNIESSCTYMPASTLPESAGRLMVEVHYYDPGQFCGTFDATGANAYYYWGAGNHSSSHNATWGEENYMQEQFAKLKTTYTSKGYPVIIGEYACQQRTVSDDQEKHNASVKYYYQCVNQFGVNNGIIPFAWDTNDVASQRREGGSSTIIDRANAAVTGTNAMLGITQGVAAATWPY